jgi:penicillin-binding protein 2
MDWFAGETISVAIGQGPLLVTPLQVAAHTAFIAKLGIKVFPHIVGPESTPYWRRWMERNGGSISPLPDIKRSSFEKVILGMWESVNKGGTGQGARVDGFDICGKTGSTQTMSTESAERLAAKNILVKPHSWFSGFAPRETPEIVVTVLVEFGGMGEVLANLYAATGNPDHLLLARRFDDLGASRYIDACQELKTFPPDDAWVGALELKEK